MIGRETDKNRWRKSDVERERETDRQRQRERERAFDRQKETDSLTHLRDRQRDRKMKKRCGRGHKERVLHYSLTPNYANSKLCKLPPPLQSDDGETRVESGRGAVCTGGTCVCVGGGGESII